MRTRWLMAAFLAPALLFSPAVMAKAAAPILDLLGQASDSALDKLAKPGAFSADKAIRISLPGAKKLGGMMKYTDKLGLTDKLNENLNRAAESAAAAAKPIFRSAINKITLQDAANIVTGGDTAGTDYLQRSSGSEIEAQIRPLVSSALTKSGAFKQLKSLQQLGISDSTLTDHVTRGAAKGVFNYMGSEETKLRADPLKGVKSLLKDFKP